jgi:hypothetical protein
VPARFDPRLRRAVGQVPMRYGAAVPMPAPVPWPTGPVHVVVVDPRGLGDAAYVGRNFSSAPAFPDNAEWSAFAPWEPPVAPVDGAMANEIQGDILADSEGRLYERRQSTVRPVFDMRPVGLKRSSRPPIRPVVDPAAGPRWLRLGEWRAMLAPQLAQPDRLRDGHLLACALRVFEIGERMPADHVSKQLMNGAPRGAQVVRLTVDLAVRLSLEAVCEEDEQGSGAEALPGDRFLRIDVIEDPTRAIPAATATPSPAAAVASPSPVPVSPPPPEAAPRAPARTIPERFLGPWAFRLSREEASWHAARDAAAPAGRLRAWCARWWHRADWRRWRSLLTGQPVDEQLWGVRPPRGAWRDAELQQWLRNTLAAAGYEAGTLAGEWEIYWRRKGC